MIPTLIDFIKMKKNQAKQEYNDALVNFKNSDYQNGVACAYMESAFWHLYSLRQIEETAKKTIKAFRHE